MSTTPNYDLGTAHANVRIDSDTRGSDKAEKSVKGFQRAIEAIVSRLAGFQAAMDRIESELNQVTRDFDQADRAARDFERDMSKARGTTINWTRDLHELHTRLRGISEAAATYGPAAIQVTRFLNAFRRTNDLRIFSDNVNLVQRGLRSFFRIGGSAYILDALRSKFFGMGAAIATVQGPMRDVVRVASGFQSFAAVASILGVAVTHFGLATKAAAALKVGLSPLTALLERHGKTWADILAPLDGVISRFGGLKNVAQSLWKNMDGLAGSTLRAIGGFAVMRTNVNALIARFSFLSRIPLLWRAAIATAFTFGEAAVQGFAAALRGASNLLVGLLDGVKQLAGGYLALPGAIATAVTAFGTLKFITEGIKDSFKDILKAKDANEMAEAVKALPDALKPFGQALADVLPKWKELKTAVTATFLGGADNQLRLISDAYLPRMRNGLLQVSNSWKIAKDRALEFLASAQTQSDLNRLFSNTSQIINQLSSNIAPAAAGLRDIAIVGSDFIKEMSAGLPSLVDKFAEWARVNRENGNLMRWMKDSVAGAKDLVRGIIDATKAVWTLLTLFQTKSGDNFLDRFAASMAKFNQTVQNSAAGGVLRQIADAVKSMGTDKLKEFWEVLKSVGNSLLDIVPFVKQMSDAFRTIFLPVLKGTIEVIDEVIQVLNQFGAGTILGGLLGMIAAWKTMALVLGPIKNLFLGIWGAVQFFKGAQGIIINVANALENFGSAGKKASGFLLGIGDSVASFVNKLSIAGVAIAGFWLLWQEGDRQINDLKQGLDDAKKHVDDFKDSLRGAFFEDRGLVGKNVFSSVKSGVDQMLVDLKANADKVPGILANLKASFDPGREADVDRGGFFGQRNPWFQGREFNALQKAAQDAAHAQKAFDRLGLSSENLSSIVTGSQSIFDQFQNTLRNSGEGGNEAAAQLDNMRRVFNQMQQDFQQAGPGAVKLAQGIQQIAQSAGDTQTKLDGLKTALEGLGLLQTNEYQAAFDYAQAIQGLGDALANAADQGAGFENIFDQNGRLIAGLNVNASNLFNIVAPLADKFLNLAAKGGDVNQMWADMQPQIHNIAQAFHQTDDQIRNLLSQLGVDKRTVKILLSLEGKDQVTQDLTTIMLWAEKNVGKGINVPIIVKDPHQAEAAIEKIFGDIADSTDNAIRFKFNVDPAALAVLKQTLAAQGVSIDGTPVDKPAEVPVAPAPAGGPAPAPPPPVKTTVDQSEIDNYKKTIGDLQKQVDDLNNKPTKIQVDTANLAEIKTKIQEIQNIVKDGKLEFTIIAKGYDETVAVINRVKDAVNSLIDRVGAIAPAFAQAMSQSMYALATMANQMQTAGQKMMSDLAQGIRDGTASQVIPAVDAMLQAIKDRHPSSPPKKGPLAGSNYVDRSGLTMASDFAAGITSGRGRVEQAANYVAGAARAGIQSEMGPYNVGAALGQLSSISQLFQHIFDAVFAVANIGVNIAKFASDPLQKGTFFGQSIGAALGFRRDPNVSDADLRRKREDALQAKLQDAAGSPAQRGGSIALGANPSKTEIAQAIAAEAFARGYDRNTAIGAIAAARLESGLDPNVTNATGHQSLFQTSADKGVGLDPNAQIKWFFDTMDKLGGPAAVGSDPLNFIADKIEKGGYPGSNYQQFTAEAAAIVDAMNSNTAAVQGNTTATQGATQVTGQKGLQPAAQNLLGVIEKYFPEIKNIGGVRPDALPYHSSGRALDIMIPGAGGLNDPTPPAAKALGDRIFAFLQANAQALGLDTAGTLWQQKNHFNHIHAQVLDQAQAFKNAVDPLAHGGTGALPGPDFSKFTADELAQIQDNTAYSTQTQDQMLATMRQQDPKLDEAIRVGQNPTSTDDQIATSLQVIQRSIDSQNNNDTPAGRQQLQALQGVQQSIMSERGFTTAANPIDQAASFIQAGQSIAGSVFQVINSTIEAFGAADDLSRMLIRYPENTEDVMKAIDDIQKFIKLGADIAGAVSSITGAIGGLVGAGASADPSGGAGGAAAALQAVSAIAGIIQSALETTNAIIDIAQEAYHIIGSTVVAPILQQLAGGIGMGALQGNVKFLLDQNAGQLYTYSADNPYDKRGHNVPGEVANPNAGQQLIGTVNNYMGPGQDPRDLNRQMLYQVKAAGYAGATAQ